MHRRTLLSALGLAPPLALAIHTGAQAAPPVEDNLDELVNAVHEAGMPGIFAELRAPRRRGLAAGVADVQSMRPVQPWFQHRIGSVTKSFVAAVVLQLVGEGKLRLDDPVSRHLPRLDTGSVTIRQLLNHTSGIGNYTDALFQSLDDLIEVGNRHYTPQELVTIGLSLPPTGPPGGTWSYSNTGYLILGLLIERLTGRRYATEIERRILRPLGLWRTYFPGSDSRIRGPHSEAYVPWPDGTLRDFSVYNMTWGWAAGEMISTMQDLNRFYRALFGGHVLRPSLLGEMKTTVPIIPEAPEVAGYGLGIYWQALPSGTLAWGHDGGVIGHLTLSLHTDARSLSLAENMTFYEPGPIDEALAAFAIAALEDQSAARTGAAGTFNPWHDKLTGSLIGR